MKQLGNIVENDANGLPDMAVVVDALPDAVLLLDEARKVIHANQAARQLFSSLSLHGRELSDMLGVTHPALVAAGRELMLHDVEVLGHRVASLSVVPQAWGAVVVLRVPRLSVAEDWLKMTSGLKQAQHMARMLAHEIRNPLAGIRGAAQILARAELCEQDLALARLIEAETARIARLVESANIDVAVDAASFIPVNLHAVADSAADLLKKEYPGLRLDFDYDPSLPDIAGHEDSLFRALFNLLKNAAEAGARRVTLLSRYSQQPVIHPESGVRLPMVLSIVDDGCGIDAGALPHIFEPRFSNKKDGSGLGLAIVSGIVDAHGGVVSVRSRPGQTVFELKFPRRRE